MEVIRSIGHHEILVETDEPCGIYLEESLVQRPEGADSVPVEKKAILRMLASGDEYFPLTMHWEMIDRCNLACPFCYIVGRSFEKVVRLSEIRGHLADLVNEGLLFCTLTGGEATIHPDFAEIYRFLKERGVIVEVFTNGIAVDDDLIKLFTAYPPVAVEVSLYTLDDSRMADTFGAQVRGTATRVLNNVVRMRRAGVNVVCKTFRSVLTHEEVGRIEGWCIQHGIKHYVSSELTQGYDGTDLRKFEVPTTKQPVVGRLHPVPRTCLPCGAKNYGGAINAVFAVSPCPSIRLHDCTFDLRQLGVAEALRKMKSFMRRFQDQEIHGGTRAAGSCASCMAYAKPVRSETGELLHFSDA